ncbi:lipid asymmetry maintenance protein MlaB [Modestobacter sp. KNN46-3]|uniref:STAS domain-containing protein n=1 Tax=Modestobacter sp. KNN46-3 TaxID=2711218 RepID=UPI001F14AA5E|nr:STAS domain-containing protein [Modestobacter sp. KNN46-3]
MTTTPARTVVDGERDRPAVHAGDRDPGEHTGPEGGGGAGQRDDQPRVVDQLPVPEDDAAAPRAHTGHQPGDALRPDPAGAGQGAAPAGHGEPDGIAQPPAEPGQRADVPAGHVGHQERQPPDQVGCGDAHQHGALPSAVPGQPDLPLRQVPQPAVHQLRRPAAGARGQVHALAQRDAQPAGGGVQRDPGAGDPTAHDQDVDPLGDEPVEVAGPAARVERCGPGDVPQVRLGHRQTVAVPDRPARSIHGEAHCAPGDRVSAAPLGYRCPVSSGPDPVAGEVVRAEDGAGPLLRFSGRIDREAVRRFRVLVTPADWPDRADLSAVTEIDAAGLQLLVHLSRKPLRRGQRLRLLAVPAALQPALVRAGLSRLLTGDGVAPSGVAADPDRPAPG